MKNFLLRHQNSIVIFWLIGILVFFKIKNNFYFTNNESLVFILLLVSVPIILQVLVIRKRRQLRLQNHLNGEPFFEQIMSDIKNERIIAFFPHGLVDKTANSITIKSLIVIEFTDTSASCTIKNTKVVFHFYYNRVDTKLVTDEDGFKYYPRNFLYQQILKRVNSLLGIELIYEEYYTKQMLVAVALSTTEGIVYQSINKIPRHARKEVHNINI